MRISAIMLVACAVSCQEPAVPSSHGPLRVSAGHQLTCFAARSGSSAYAQELVSTWLNEYADIIHENETAITLKLKSDIPYSLAFVCAHVHADDGRAIAQKNVVHNACEIRFTSAEAKKRFADSLWLDTGRYEIDHLVPLDSSISEPCSRGVDDAHNVLLERMVLRSKEPMPINEIRIIPMPLHEQWRQLFARTIDVIPSTPMLYAEQFQDMHSVRTVALQTSSALALYFNTARPPWDSRDNRAALVAALDIDAVARIACRAPECSDLGDFSPQPPTGRATLPPELTILLYSDDSKAAEVIRYQLRDRSGVTATLEERTIAEILARIAEQDFELLLLPVPLIELNGGRDFVERVKRTSVWRDPAMEAAAEQGNVAQIAAIAGAELPVVPLFRYLQFAAIDNRFCGGPPDSQTSWVWLADLYPCIDEGVP